MDALQILLWPFLTCLVLTGIHAYLGLHVVERGVIFVDLSLAQVAALGTTIAFLFGYGLHGQAAYFFSLAFAILGAGLFALTRAKGSRIPQEAIIGIVYAVSAALGILIIDRAPEGTEHIKYILVGNLLAVHPQEVLKMAGLYFLVGVVHWIYRQPLVLISTHPQKALAEGYRIRWWDFLFYTTFGFVVTSSVAVAGVLLVFVYLVVPSVAGMILARQLWSRLAVGWALGVVCSVAGMCFSYFFDAPSGASIVCAFGAALALIASFKYFST